MKAKKSIIVVAIAVIALAASLGVLSYVSYAKGFKEFIADGYILKPSTEVNVAVDSNEQHYFSQGSKYLAKYGSKVTFTDAAGEEVTLNKEQFLHYSDGSLGSFTKGVIMDVTNLSDEQYGYYNLTQNTILVKNGKSYEVSTRGEAMNLDEFIWKITDTEYMLVSPEVTLQLGNSNMITLPDYAQIKYVDNGVVRIVHQQGTYQTVSSEAFLTTAAGAELNLVGKNFFINGEPGISLDRMSLNDDSYIDLDENSDTPEIKIPQFNVVNGKDGASGANGANGEDGGDGENGVEGLGGGDGGDGSGGAGGASGGAGGKGSDGGDGLEGDTGVMGYDGKPGTPGKNGEDGKRKDEESGIVSAEVNVRPTVTMETNGFKTSPDSAEMHLNLSDVSDALVADSVEVAIYERDTMKLVANPMYGTWASDLAGGSAALNITGLDPDREYVLIVSGEYYSDEEDTDGRSANLFTKIFRTDSVGVTLEKLNVTDSSITLLTRKTSTNVVNYTVRLYTRDENGNPSTVGNYTTGDTRKELPFSQGVPITSTPEIKSNTLYYAVFDKVSYDPSGELSGTSLEGTEIEIRTLKEKPYIKDSDDNKKPAIATAAPVAAVDNKLRTLTLTLPKQIVDNDNGIVQYRYELYKAEDVQTAKAGGNLSNLEPAFRVEADSLKNQTFQLQLDENAAQQQQYMGRIIVVFNDNENEIELATDFSNIDGLAGSQFPLVEFENVDRAANKGGRHDKIEGYIKVKDPSNVLLQYLGGAYDTELILTMTSEYETEPIGVKVKVSEVPSYAGADNAAKYFSFSQDGLRQDSVYTLTLQGPVSMDDDVLTEDERKTYLAGKRVLTVGVKGFSLVGSPKPNAATAFSMRVNFTAGADEYNNTDESLKEFYEYEMASIEEIELGLFRRNSMNEEFQMGQARSIKDLLTEDYFNSTGIGDKDGWKHQSDLVNGWIDFDKVQFVTKDQNKIANWVKGFYVNEANANKAAGDKLVLTPSSFGVDDNDNTFFNGNTFIIRALSAKDYTTYNNIGFTENGKQIEFELEKKHTQADDPNSQVVARLITKAQDARTDEKSTKNDVTLNNDTVVGVTFEGLYRYSDALSMTYHIYELDDTKDSPDDVPEDEDAPLLYYDIKASTDDYKKIAYQYQYYLTEEVTLSDGTTETRLKLDDKGRPIPDQTKPGSAVPIARRIGTLTLNYNTKEAKENSTRVGSVTLYFNDLNNPRCEMAESYSSEWKDADGVSLTQLLRGGRYFIAYETVASWEAGIDDGDDNKDDIYPNCTYNEGDLIPFYRSSVFSLSKQMPKIERYLWTESENSVTWKYRIIDPDKTVPVNASGKMELTWKSSEASNMSTPYLHPAVSVDADGANSILGTDYTTQPFNTVTFTSASPKLDKRYYTVGVAYYETDYDAAYNKSKTIESAPVYKQPAMTYDTNILLQGRPFSSGQSKPADKDYGNEGYELALVNQGGYRYVLTLWGRFINGKDKTGGTTLDNITALRVTFYGQDSSHNDLANGKKVIYDPVYIDIIETEAMIGTQTYPLALGYLDTSPLQLLLDDPDAKYARVEVGAYYNTGVSGFSDFVTTSAFDVENGTSFNGDNVYALKWMQTDGSYVTKVLAKDEKNKKSLNFGDSPSGTRGKSIFRPMAQKAAYGDEFIEQLPGTAAKGVLTGSLGVYYATAPMSLAKSANDKLIGAFEDYNPIEFAYDKNGALITSKGGAGSYVTVEKLAYHAVTLKGDAHTVTLSDIFPAIEKINSKVNAGVHGFYMEFDTKGAGAYEGKELYAFITESKTDANGSLEYGFPKILRLVAKDNSDNKDDRAKLYYDVSTDVSKRYLDSAAVFTTNKNSQTKDPYENKAYYELAGIKIQKNDDGTYYLPIRVRGLYAKTTYNITIFTYDSKGNYVDLYSIDANEVGHSYEVPTKTSVNVQLTDGGYTYTDYDNKHRNIRFNVGTGEDGLDMDVYYNVYDITGLATGSDGLPKGGATGTKLWDEDVLLPTNPENITALSRKPYYSNNPANNPAMSMLLPPDQGRAGALKMGHQYYLKVTVKDKNGGDLLSDESRMYKLPFSTKATMDPPTINLKAQGKIASDGTTAINADISVMDSNRTMTTVDVYLYEEDGTTLVDQSLNNRINFTWTNKRLQVQFTKNLVAGKNYVVQFVGKADLNNDGSFETTYKRETTVSLTSKVTSTLGLSADTSMINLTLDDLQNFSKVTKVQITVYAKTKDGLIPISVKNNPQPITAGQTHYDLNFGWDAPKESTSYEVQIQYLGDGATPLGDDIGTLNYKVPTALGTAVSNLLKAVTKSSDEKPDATTSAPTEKTEPESVEPESEAPEIDPADAQRETEIREQLDNINWLDNEELFAEPKQESELKQEMTEEAAPEPEAQEAAEPGQDMTEEQTQQQTEAGTAAE